MGQDNHIQNGGLGRYSVGYTFGNHILHKTKFLIVYPTILAPHMSHCQNLSKFLSVSYLMKTADVIMIFFSSHNTSDHT